jgi:hypothetical protein
MRNNRSILLFVLVALGVMTSACGSAPTQAPVVQTVVQTVPVEVTRNVEVTRMVEVTRDVVVTQVLEVPVTITPALPSATPTFQYQSQQPTLLVNLTPPVTPQAKFEGYTAVFVQNQTSDKMDVYLAGPDQFSLALWGGDQQKIWTREGNYEYIVSINGQEAYRGKFKIVSADKYVWNLYKNKAILQQP